MDKCCNGSCQDHKCCKSHFLVLKDFWLDHDVLIKKGQIITEPINPEWRPRLVQQIFPELENCREAALYIANNQNEENEIENLLKENNNSSELSSELISALKDAGLIACLGCSRCNDIVFET